MKKKTNPFWQPMIDHINSEWKAKKGWAAETKPEFNYPFTGQDWKKLKHWSGVYLETGIMALWDAYLVTADEWTAKHGFSIQDFERQLPRLVDDYGWKKRRDFYDSKFPSQTPPEIEELFPVLNVIYPEPTRKQSRNRDWARKNPSDPRAKKYLSA